MHTIRPWCHSGAHHRRGTCETGMSEASWWHWKVKGCTVQILFWRWTVRENHQFCGGTHHCGGRGAGKRHGVPVPVFHFGVAQWVEDKGKRLQTVQNVLCAVRQAERKVISQRDFGCILRQFWRLQVRENILHSHKAGAGKHRMERNCKIHQFGRGFVGVVQGTWTQLHNRLSVHSFGNKSPVRRHKVTGRTPCVFGNRWRVPRTQDESDVQTAWGRYQETQVCTDFSHHNGGIRFEIALL